MGKNRQNISQALSSERLKELDRQAFDDLLNAKDINDVLNALSRGLWLKAHKAECPPKQFPTFGDLMSYTTFLTDSDIEQVIEQIEQLSRWFFREVHDNVAVQAGWIVPRHALPCHTLIHYIKTRFSEKSIGESETIYRLLTGHNVKQPIYPENVFFEVYKAWIEAKQDGFEGSHPLSLLIELWHNRPPKVREASVKVSGDGVVIPYEISQWARVHWHEVANVDTVEIDGVPFAAKMNEIGMPLFPNMASAIEHKNQGKKPVIYASTGDPIEQQQLSLAFTTPRKPIETPVALMAYELFGFDLRKSLASDCAFLMKLVFASNQSLHIPKHDGAQLLARDRKGNFRRVQESDEQRFEVATNAIRNMTPWFQDDRGIFRWFPLMEVTKKGDGEVFLSKPSWFLEKRYTLTGGLTNASARLQGQINDGGIWRTIDAMEYYLARSAPVRRGKFAGIAKALTPANGRTGSGPWEKLTRNEFFRLTGDNTYGVADSTLRKRFFDRKNSLDDAGYITAGNRPARANDTVEFHFVRGGVWVRATQKGVEAARKAQEGEVETRSLNDILGNPFKV